MIFDKEFRARALAVLTLGLIFGAGFGIGLAVERNLIAGPADDEPTAERMAEDGTEDERRDDDDDDRGLIVERVGLTPEQKVLVQQTVDEIWERMREVTREKRQIDREFNERSRAIIQEGRAAIMEHLTEEQQLEYERLLEEADERRREERRNRNRDDDDRDKDDRSDPDPRP